MLTLYQRTDCPFCWKVRIALAELDIEYQSVDTVLGEKHPEVQRLSPTGTVPVLVDGDVVIWESAVIFDYLDSRYAPEKLISRDPAQQARESRSAPNRKASGTRTESAKAKTTGTHAKPGCNKNWGQTPFSAPDTAQRIAPWPRASAWPRPMVPLSTWNSRRYCSGIRP
jgi:glutaredoxin